MLVDINDIKALLKDENVAPVAMEFSSDTITAVTAFKRVLNKKKKSFFLESIEGGERIGRYSFLGIDPFEIIRVRKNRVTIEGKHQRVVVGENPFTVIQKHLSQYRALKFPQLPPFCGGAIGHVGFDAIRYIENMPKPKSPSFNPIDDIHLMLFKDVIAFDRVKDRIILISNIFLDEEDLETGVQQAKERLEKIAQLIFTPHSSEKLQNIQQNLTSKGEPKLTSIKATMGRSKFIAAVKKIKQHIRRGDIFQCVLSDQFTIPIKVDPFQIYRALRSISPAPYLFYLSTGKNTLLGASPETLVKVTNRVIETCPIAGTRARGKTDQLDRKLERELLASVKERAEHLMLVDLGRNDIGKVAVPGSVKVNDFMHIQKFSNVMHIVSLVNGKLKRGKNAWDAFRACFPAGTLSGAPKIRAMEIIHHLESCSRGPYGGAIVYFDFSGNLDSCITIRSLLIQKSKDVSTGYIQAGAGIVADSRPDFEYEEILHKSSAIKKAVAMAQRETSF